jgi:hypothetical protein
LIWSDPSPSSQPSAQNINLRQDIQATLQHKVRGSVHSDRLAIVQTIPHQTGAKVASNTFPQAPGKSIVSAP